MVLKKKAALQISFGWLFALIVGAVILFLAIYFSARLINTQEYELDTKTAKEIEVLLNPLETGFEDKSTSTLKLPSETKIYNRCYESGDFGEQGIILSQKSFGGWSDAGAEIQFSNKYIFSNENVQGKLFYLFSKKIDAGFKVTDTISLVSANEEYCFIGAPAEISEDENSLPDNVKFGLANCNSESIKVCFDSNGCDIDVKYDLNYLEKNNQKVYFNEDFVYPAIFSNIDIYECQLKRIMKRVSVLCDLYLKKSEIVSRKDCDTNVDVELMQLKNFADKFQTSQDLNLLNNIIEELNYKNDNSVCRMW